MLAAVILGLILGAVNGVIITKGKVAPFIATLATMTIYRGLTLVYTDGRPVSGLGDSVAFQMFGKGYFFGIPVPVITMILAFVILYFILHKTTFGRRVYAVGGNEEASKLCHHFLLCSLHTCQQYNFRKQSILNNKRRY